MARFPILTRAGSDIDSVVDGAANIVDLVLSTAVEVGVSLVLRSSDGADKGGSNHGGLHLCCCFGRELMPAIAVDF